MKKIKPNQFYYGQFIVRTDAPDAQVYTVASRLEFNILLIWFEGERLCRQWVDLSGSMVPTVKQIENSIKNYGRLALLSDLETEIVPRKKPVEFKYDAPFNPEFLGAQRARVGKDY